MSDVQKIEEAISNSPIKNLVKVVFENGRLIIRGRVSTYYQKQLAIQIMIRHRNLNLAEEVSVN